MSGEKRDEPIDIVMVAWKREPFTERAIRAIYNNTIHPFRLTLIENESKTDWMTKEPRLDNFVAMNENHGLEPAKNIGMSFVKSRYFISTDNDCLPMKPSNKKCWLTRLIELMDNNPEYGAISCRTQVMIGTGNIYEDKEDQDIVEFPHPGGSLRIMKTDVVKKIGGWRSSMRGRGSEEKYICGKIGEMGIKTGFATHIKTYHLFGEGNGNVPDWGYTGMRPEKHGHTMMYHPSLMNGDDQNEIRDLCGDV